MREPDLRLLCERCGYHLKGMRRADVCPECGVPVKESLPEKRVGSAWQQHPGWRSWWRTERSMESHPRAIWTRLAVGTGRDTKLVVINCTVAGLAATAALLPMYAPSIIWGESIAVLVWPAVLGISLIFSYLAMTGIEAIGIGAISRRRGWRIHRGAQGPILAHASYAWILCAALLLCGHIGGILARPYSYTFRYAGLGAGFLIGLLVFETLVYIGMRKMRYANAPGSEKELAEEDTGQRPVPPRSEPHSSP